MHSRAVLSFTDFAPEATCILWHALLTGKLMLLPPDASRLPTRCWQRQRWAFLLTGAAVALWPTAPLTIFPTGESKATALHRRCRRVAQSAHWHLSLPGATLVRTN